MKKITAVVLGYGGRGATYARYAVEHPEELEIVAVAEPMQNKWETIRKSHNLSEDKVFSDWKDLAQQPKMADFAIIATQDSMHYEPALAMIEKGYHLLLEKPIAPTPEECKAIAEAAEKKGVRVIVCHVLRYTNFWCAVKNMIDNGDLGEIMSVIHMENVGNEHQSHSFVRGPWRNSKESSCMILAKSCHDMDLLQWLIGKPCKRVQSFGSLTHFTKANQPEGAPDYCLQGCPVADTCYYNAEKIYCNMEDDRWYRYHALKAIAGALPTGEEVRAAMVDGPYGRCVYACDNDVVDHQVVNLEFEGGCTVSFTMNAFNAGGRFIRIFGTKGELVGDMGNNSIELFSFDTRETKHYDTEAMGFDITSGHGGGDTGIMRDLLQYLNTDTPSKSISSVRTSYVNHLISFAAEESRLSGTVVDLEAYEQGIGEVHESN